MQEWMGQGLIIFSFLVVFSVSYIVSMWYAAAHRIGKTPTEPQQLWLERWIGKGAWGYLAISLILPALVIALDYFVAVIRTQPVGQADLVGYFILLVSSWLGLWFWRKVYCVYLEALPEMSVKVAACSEEVSILGGRVRLTRTELQSALKGFGVVAGSDSMFSMVNLTAAFVVYALFQYLLAMRGVYYGPGAILVTLLNGGLTGPIATVSMAFAVFCSLVFRDSQFYDLYAYDRRGGFEPLGRLVTWATIATFTAAVGVPVGYVIRAPKTVWETSLTFGMTLFIAFCVASFYVVPVLSLHWSMKGALESHRKKIREEDRRYDSILSGMIVPKPDIQNRDIFSFQLRRERTTYARESSDWPVGYGMFVKIIPPILASIGSLNMENYVNLITFVSRVAGR